VKREVGWYKQSYRDVVLAAPRKRLVEGSACRPRLSNYVAEERHRVIKLSGSGRML
jgi:hypothetical protein